MVPRARTDGGIVSVSLNTNSFLCSFLCVRASLASKMDYKKKSQRRLAKAEVSTISSNQKRERVKCKSRPTASLQKKKNSKNTNGVWCESKTQICATVHRFICNLLHPPPPPCVCVSGFLNGAHGSGSMAGVADSPMRGGTMDRARRPYLCGCFSKASHRGWTHSPSA